ncbi:hypothetical protein TNCV_1929881 [Trichonephila clavipes]|nr:hypothetical protein TNCV_1929881 [Trichonephila clavipes]
MHPVACIPVTPSHACCVMTEVIGGRRGFLLGFLMKSSFAFSPGRKCVGQKEANRNDCNQTVYGLNTPGVMVKIATSFDNKKTLVVMPNTLPANLYGSLSVDMLHWPAKSPDLSPIEHVCLLTSEEEDLWNRKDADRKYF